MNCDVCIGVDFGDCDGSPEFFNRQEVKARKPHKCMECRVIIAKGEKYQRDSGKYDGQCYTDHTCLPCAEIRHVFSCGEIEPVGQLWCDFPMDDLRMAGECWDSLSAAAKAKLLEKWRSWKGVA